MLAMPMAAGLPAAPSGRGHTLGDRRIDRREQLGGTVERAAATHGVGLGGSSSDADHATSRGHERDLDVGRPDVDPDQSLVTANPLAWHASIIAQERIGVGPQSQILAAPRAEFYDLAGLQRGVRD